MGFWRVSSARILLNSQQGFSIINVLVAMGLAAVLLTFVMQTGDLSAKIANTASEGTAVQDFGNQIRMIGSSTGFCNQNIPNLSNIEFDPTPVDPDPLTSEVTINMTALEYAGGTPVTLPAGLSYASTTPLQLQVTAVMTPDTQYLGKIVMNFDKNMNTYGSAKSVAIDVVLNTSISTAPSVQIDSCTGTLTGGGGGGGTVTALPPVFRSLAGDYVHNSLNWENVPGLTMVTPALSDPTFTDITYFIDSNCNGGPTCGLQYQLVVDGVVRATKNISGSREFGVLTWAGDLTPGTHTVTVNMNVGAPTGGSGRTARSGSHGKMTFFSQ